MPIFVITHARRHVKMGNAYHTEHGLADLSKLKDLTAALLKGRKEKVKLIAFGVGDKYEDIMRIFHKDEAFFQAKIFPNPLLGGAESRSEWGLTTPGGSTFPIEDYWGWEKVTKKNPEIFWQVLEEEFPCEEDEIILFCVGKQFFTYIGKERYFQMGSIYELFLPKRFIKLREDLIKKRNRIIKH